MANVGGRLCRRDHTMIVPVVISDHVATRKYALGSYSAALASLRKWIQFNQQRAALVNFSHY
jgi:hypothetical protein